MNTNLSVSVKLEVAYMDRDLTVSDLREFLALCDRYAVPADAVVGVNDSFVTSIAVDWPFTSSGAAVPTTQASDAGIVAPAADATPAPAPAPAADAAPVAADQAPVAVDAAAVVAPAVGVTYSLPTVD